MARTSSEAILAPLRRPARRRSTAGRLSKCLRSDARSFQPTVRVGYDQRMSIVNTFGTRTTLTAGGRTWQIYSLPALETAGYPEIARLPYSMKILLENRSEEHTS